MKSHYDVLIIGSGASGGTVAYTLARKGISCVMLDAGPVIDYAKHRELKKVCDLPYRGFDKPGRFPHVTQANEFNGNLWADEKQNPYTYDPNDPYYWVRVRLVGGKTLLWGRAAWRMCDLQFRSKDHDGFGENWPIRYQDIAPYYDKVEPLWRVSGRREGLPQIPDGVFLEDTSHDSESVQRFVQAAKARGIPTTKPRRATGTLASSINLLLPTALETGYLTVIPNAVVSKITTNKDTGLVNGALFIDRRSHREMQVKARVVVVGASCLESTRLLLNSGLANSSGVLGRYLFDQFYVKDSVEAIVPEARGKRNTYRLMGGGGYIPQFRNVRGKEKEFIRGYAVDFSSGGTPPTRFLPGYGEALQKQVSELRDARFTMTVMGTVLPRYENYVQIDKTVRDAWGIPVLNIHARYTENEFNMAQDAADTLEEVSRAAGFEILAKHPKMVPPGESIHELGTCRMGDDPKTSVLNRWNQTHDIKNLFVVDGSSFTSGGSQNPTLTISALAMRSADYMAEQMRAQNL
ncbi:MAG TPA: GMC family oxidoreductase [Bryobacteraceae bacterium]